MIQHEQALRATLSTALLAVVWVGCGPSDELGWNGQSARCEHPSIRIVSPTPDADGDVDIDVLPAGPRIVQLAPGYEHSCALTSEGAVKCWGRNILGQLGTGDGLDQLAPVGVPAFASGVRSLASGSDHSCVVLSSGGAKCWGRNDYGQLGDGTKTNRVTPVDVVGVSSAVAIRATTECTCAISATGGVKCWGICQVGRGLFFVSTAQDVPQLSAGIADVALGISSTCALTSAGTVKCAAHETDFSDVEGLSGVKAIAVGVSHACAVIDTGAVKCWGANWAGQLGDGTNVDSATPVDVKLRVPAVAIASGEEHVCAMTADGAVHCWGQLNGYSSDFQVHQILGPSPGAGPLDAGDYHTCAGVSEGAVKCWGRDWHGQLGDGYQWDEFARAPVFRDPLVPVSVIGFHGPAGGSASAQVEFTHDQTVLSDIRCQLDDAAPAPCSSPWELMDLQPGLHKITVSGSTSAGTPISSELKLAVNAVDSPRDTTPPVTYISGPPAPYDEAPTFTFSSNERDVTYQCAPFTDRETPVLDADCGSSYTPRPPFSQGYNAVLARAKDAAGNFDMQPPHVVFRVLEP